MLTIRTKVRPSDIEGLGLFADEDIPLGTVIWKFNSIIDKHITQDEYESLPPNMQEFINTYACTYEKENFYFLALDNDRFTNHSENPNTKFLGGLDEEGTVIATRDIKKGEEITSNYREFDKASRDENYTGL